MRVGILPFAVLALFPSAAAQAQTVTFNGQVRPRTEYRDPSGATSDAFTSMRIRAAVRALVDPKLTVFIQAQDVRTWGEETNTLGDFRADNLDIHQAYLRYNGERLPWLTTTLGRQETDFGGQRLVGSVGWTQQGRSFDGVRMDAAGGKNRVSFIAYVLADATAPAHDTDAELYGAYATLGAVGPGALDLYWLHDVADADGGTSQATVGARYAFQQGRVTGRLESSLQRGERAGTDVSAYMVGARLGTSFAQGKGSVTLWYDLLSGDDDPSDDEVGVFSTLYATNHKFYGFADLFLDLPGHTAGRGLTDLAAKLTWRPSGSVTFGADLHSFAATESAGLTTAHLANELDLTLTHRYSANLGVTAGASFVRQDDGLAEIGRLEENMTWFYVMFDAIF